MPHRVLWYNLMAAVSQFDRVPRGASHRKGDCGCGGWTTASAALSAPQTKGSSISPTIEPVFFTSPSNLLTSQPPQLADVWWCWPLPTQKSLSSFSTSTWNQLSHLRVKRWHWDFLYRGLVFTDQSCVWSKWTPRYLYDSGCSMSTPGCPQAGV